MRPGSTPSLLTARLPIFGFMSQLGYSNVKMHFFSACGKVETSRQKDMTDKSCLHLSRQDAEKNGDQG
ncbi:rCG26555, isoform CRA_a [Rattus norvegicus]|uniref:RCG26555, isoform CRA_a n=1 Tax=Rattus norvegicus TaxID=10116 RepID=A6HP71_RAT|nr:rCG26555, isoform CRA_a [Rattus norvegicus]